VASWPKFSASASASSSCNAGLVLTKVVLMASLPVVEIMSFTFFSDTNRGFVGCPPIKAVAHSDIKLKQNTETATNGFRLVSASLADLFAYSKIC